MKKTDLKNGYVTYRRRKTGQQLIIEWTKEMQMILDKYPENYSNQSRRSLIPFAFRVILPRADFFRFLLFSFHRVNKVLLVWLGFALFRRLRHPGFRLCASRYRGALGTFTH